MEKCSSGFRYGITGNKEGRIIRIHDIDEELSTGRREGVFAVYNRSELRPVSGLQKLWNRIRLPVVLTSYFRRLSS